MATLFPGTPPSLLTVAGRSETFPVRRIYCVGRNYADHIVEMGGDPDRDPPFFFSKPADALWQGTGTVAFPPKTDDLHFEMELIVAIGSEGADIPVSNALDHVIGYAAGVDLTRRDLQAWAKKNGRPWDMAKSFDDSAPMSPLMLVDDIGHPESGAIKLTVNGKIKQDGDLAQQIWKVPEIVANLSTFIHLQPGDLIMTGTPAGVGPLNAGDRVEGRIDQIGTIAFVMGPKP